MPLALAALALLVAPAASVAATAHDPADSPGPLDLVKVKVGQDATRLKARIGVSSPLPRTAELRLHPAFEKGKPERYLCLNLAARSIGRRLYCPAGHAHDGRIPVGVSVVGKHSIRGNGSVDAAIERSKRGMVLRLGLDELGIDPGRLGFSAASSWYGPACVPGGSRGDAVCTDRAPDEGAVATEINPVRRVGCTGVGRGTVHSGPSAHKWVALTFDDGPSIYTDDVLRILDHNHVHGTFFQIGEQVPAYAALDRRILEHGNEIGNHSWHHDMGPGEADLRHTSNVIEHATGFRPCMFRPPGGYLPSVTSAAASALDMVSVIWDVDTRDWTTPGSASIYHVATSGGRGSIVLMHDGGGNRSQTVAALPGIIHSYKARGYEMKTMTQLLGGHYVLREDKGHRRVWDPPAAKPAEPIRREGP
ncbi:MAG: polysaccharide deacetylase family protein [Solirubrobacterales bacterium]